MAAAVTPTSSAAPAQFNEGLALFLTFSILIVLSTRPATSKFALWVSIALFALVWSAAWRTPSTLDPGSNSVQSFWKHL
jgi:hypothetical protein